MRVTRRGKCSVEECDNRVTEHRDFYQNVDLFDQTPDMKIKGELEKELRKFKKEPLFCPEHHPDPKTIEVIA